MLKDDRTDGATRANQPTIIWDGNLRKFKNFYKNPNMKIPLPNFKLNKTPFQDDEKEIMKTLLFGG